MLASPPGKSEPKGSQVGPQPSVLVELQDKPRKRKRVIRDEHANALSEEELYRRYEHASKFASDSSDLTYHGGHSLGGLLRGVFLTADFKTWNVSNLDAGHLEVLRSNDESLDPVHLPWCPKFPPDRPVYGPDHNSRDGAGQFRIKHARPKKGGQKSFLAYPHRLSMILMNRRLLNAAQDKPLYRYGYTNVINERGQWEPTLMESSHVANYQKVHCSHVLMQVSSRDTARNVNPFHMVFEPSIWNQSRKCCQYMFNRAVARELLHLWNEYGDRDTEADDSIPSTAVIHHAVRRAAFQVHLSCRMLHKTQPCMFYYAPTKSVFHFQLPAHAQPPLPDPMLLALETDDDADAFEASSNRKQQDGVASPPRQRRKAEEKEDDARLSDHFVPPLRHLNQADVWPRIVAPSAVLQQPLDAPPLPPLPPAASLMPARAHAASDAGTDRVAGGGVAGAGVAGPVANPASVREDPDTITDPAPPRFEIGGYQPIIYISNEQGWRKRKRNP